MAQQLAFWTRQAAMRRLSLAVALSAFGHAAVLAGAPGPGMGELSLFPRQSGPVSARLAPAPESVWPGVPPVRIEPVFAGVPPVDIAQTPGGTSDTSAGLPTGEVFYRGSEVDQRAEQTNHPDLEYPPEAFSAGVTGVVRLQLKIDQRGELSEAKVLSAFPEGVFDQAALKAARALKFRPAVRNGVAVGSIKVIEVPFEPNCLRTGSCVPEADSSR